MTRTDKVGSQQWTAVSPFLGLVSTVYRVSSHFVIYVRWLFGWCYISSLHSADELQQERNSCPLLRSCFIGSCHVGVSKRFSRSITRQSCSLRTVFTHFLADQISWGSYVSSVYRLRSLAVNHSKHEPAILSRDIG